MTKNVHELVFGELVMHNSCMTNSVSALCASPTITHDDQTTYQTIANAHNNSITWGKQSYCDLGKILTRSSQLPGPCA